MSLRQFVESETVGGLRDAVIQQALTGDGVGENLLGIRLQSGIQVQAFVTDMFESIRRGIGAAESLGYTPGVVVMNLTDWTTIELTKTGMGGGYLLGEAGSGAPALV